jgi:hypothetical protein
MPIHLELLVELLVFFLDVVITSATQRRPVMMVTRRMEMVALLFVKMSVEMVSLMAMKSVMRDARTPMDLTPAVLLASMEWVAVRTHHVVMV